MKIVSNLNGTTKTTTYGDKLWYRTTSDGTYIQIKKAYYRESPNDEYTQVYLYDETPPTLTVVNPASANSDAPTVATAGAYTVSGTVSDTESGLASLTVNGNDVTVSGNTWSYDITISTAVKSTITVVATDNAGNSSTITRYVAGRQVSTSAPISSFNYGGHTNRYALSNYSVSYSDTLDSSNMSYSTHGSAAAWVTITVPKPYGAKTMSFSVYSQSGGDTNGSSTWQLRTNSGTVLKSGSGGATVDVSAYMYRTDIYLYVNSTSERGEWIGPYSTRTWTATASVSGVTVGF